MWENLQSTSEVEFLKSISNTTPVLIFKHSTRCGISRFVLKNFESEYNIAEEDLKIYFLDLIKYREVSNYIAQHFNVQHQSPQILVIIDGKVVLTESHNQISVQNIKNVL